MPTGDEWIDAFSARLGTAAPDADERAMILALAGVAAHSSERIAAPIACWVAGRHGVTLEEAMRVAQELVAAGEL
ncbi:MAG: hypothetical protein H0V22_11650 [Solirubrobacterales bacterium]|jgi:hypothetical protein|nr:hypothetical protein [Solirubrobacterales bacterium]